MKISLHIHSNYSTDSTQRVEDIISQCLSLGYDAIAITDHNTVGGSMEAAQLNPEGLEIIVGAEFSTDKGHILALFIDEQIEKDCKKIGKVYDFEDLILRVRKQGGLLFLAHPSQSSAVTDPSFISKLDGYELINARVFSSHHERKALRLNKTLQESYPDKIRIGGSDAHTNSEIPSLYMTMTDDENLKNALMEIQNIYFKKSSMANIRFSNMIHNKNKSFKFYMRQFILTMFGLLYDLNTKLRGNNYEIIRVCKESK